MKSAMETGNMTTKWINGTLYFWFGFGIFGNESLASLFVCGKKSLLLLYSCVFAAFFAAAAAIWNSVCFFLFSSGDGCSAYFLLSVSIPVVF